MNLRHPLWRLAALAVVVATLFILATALGLSPAKLRDFVQGFGAMAPLAFCAIGALLIVALVPLAVVAGSAGLMFGLAVGFPVAMVAATTAAAITFVFSRRLGAGAVDRIQGARIARARAWINERGVLAVVIARVSPIPSGVVNYAGGLSTLPMRTFVVGSLLGFVPRAFAYAAVGGSLDEPGSPTMLVALALLVVVVATGAMIVRRDRRARGVAARPT